MLLIFFLVTTQIDSDRGLMRQLPPPDKKDAAEMNVREQDMLQLVLDADDQLSCNGKVVTLEQAKQEIISFLSNKRLLTKGIISVQTDRNTSYDAYFHLQDALVGVYAQLRDDIAIKKYGRPMKECTDEQRKDIQKEFPQRISEQQADDAAGQTSDGAATAHAATVKGGPQ
jgi:biopolymer transport protein ExbD